MQTSNALNQCCSKESAFAGSLEQVECNRLLLIACKKRETYIAEIQRLRSGREAARDQRAARGSLTISDIRLPLKKEFCNKIGSPSGQCSSISVLDENGNLLDRPQKKKLFVSCNPTLTSFYSKEFLPHSFFRLQLPIKVKHA